MTTTVQQYITNLLQINGFNSGEANAVMNRVIALPDFHFSGWLWSADYTTLSTSAISVIVKTTCIQAVSFIDNSESGHWARPIFALLGGVS